MNRYNVALLLLALAVGPLFLISGWLSMLAVIAIFWLLARLATRDLDRKRGAQRQTPHSYLKRRQLEEW